MTPNEVLAAIIGILKEEDPKYAWAKRLAAIVYETLPEEEKALILCSIKKN